MSEMCIPPSAPPPAPGTMRSIFDGAVLGDYSDNDSPAKIGAQIVTGFIPVYGQAADIRDTTAAIGKIWRGEPGGWKSLGLALVGIIPIVGDATKSVLRIGFKPTVRAIGAFFKETGQAWRALRSTASESVKLSIKGAIKYGQKLGSDVYRLGYDTSQLFRRTADGLSEGWKQFRKEGRSGFYEGWKAPLKSGRIDPEQLAFESNLVLPSVGTTAGKIVVVGLSDLYEILRGNDTQAELPRRQSEQQTN